MNESKLGWGDLAAIRRQARFIIAASRFQPVILGLIFMLLSSVITTVIVRITGYAEAMQTYAKAVQQGQEAVLPTLPQLSLPDVLVVILLGLVLRLLLAGFQLSMLMMTRGRLARAQDLLEGFTSPLKILATSLLVSVVTAVGYLLFLVPGIYLNYRYFYAIEALYDDRELSPIGAMRRSAELTRGHKLELFMLDLSFLPWILGNLALTMLLSVSLLDAWIQPYQRLSFAIRYNQLCGWKPEPGTMPEMPPEISEALRGRVPDYFRVEPVEPAPPEEPEAPEEAPAEEIPAPQPVEPEKPAPDLEYWKARAIRLQEELGKKTPPPEE